MGCTAGTHKNLAGWAMAYGRGISSRHCGRKSLFLLVLLVRMRQAASDDEVSISPVCSGGSRLVDTPGGEEHCVCHFAHCLL